MSRIETIKGSVKEADKMRDEIGGLSELDELYLADIEYLLSRLEIAEKAIDNVLTEYGYDHIEPSDRLKEIEYIVQEALQQLRE